MRSVKAIGDAAPGDASTTRESFSLEWRAGRTPSPILFDQAPAGKYAKIDIVFRGDDSDAFELSGFARRGDVTYPYEIEDRSQLSVSVPLPGSTSLSPGGALAVGVRIDMHEIVKDLNFNAAKLEDGKLIIDDDTPALLAAFRAALAAAIEYDDT